MIGRIFGLLAAAGAGYAAGVMAGQRGQGGSGSAGDAGVARLAHRADGSDDSGSLAAGIADEGLIPDRTDMAGTMPGGLATAS